MSVGTNKYILLNKPIDYHTDNISDENNVLNLLNFSDKTDLIPVFKLDKNSSGLTLLTNDAKLADTLNNDYDHQEKEYEIIIDDQLSKDAKKILGKGMIIKDQVYPRITIKREFNKGVRTIITAIIWIEKENHIRAMFERLGYKVLEIRRTKVNKLKLGTLPIGKYKIIKKQDII